VYDRTAGIEVPISQPPRGELFVRVNEPEIRYNGNYWWLHDNDNTGWDLTDDTIRYNNVKIRYDRSPDSAYHVRLFKYSAGSTVTDAQNRASQAIFNVSSTDTVLNLGSGLAITNNSKFRGQGVIVELLIPIGKKIKFDESVITAYNPWVVRHTWKEGYQWRDHWGSDWDFDNSFDLKPDVEYTMTSDGNLVSPRDENNNEEKIKTNKKNEQLRKSIEDREKKLDQEKQKIEEEKQRLEDSSNTAAAGDQHPRRIETAPAETYYESPLSVTALLN
jgi:hypothetical protein